MEADVEFLTVKANLIAQGLILEEEGGVRITQKGKDVSFDRWMKLSGEDKVLFGWLIKKELER